MPDGHVLRLVHVYAHPQANWHYVTEGLSPAGYELSWRAPRVGPAPPMAPVELLRRLADDIVVYRREVRALDSLLLDPPLKPGSPITAVALVTDPGLPPWRSTRGVVEFLQCVGITAQEAAACARLSTEAILEPLRALDPLLITREERAQICPTREGPSLTEGMSCPALTWRMQGARVEVSIETRRDRFAEALLHRLRKGLSFSIRGPERMLILTPGPGSPREEGERLLVPVDADALAALERSAAQLDTLVVGAARLRFFDDPALPPAPLSPLGERHRVAPEQLPEMRPHEANRLANEAFHAGDFERVLALMPVARADGDHGLLAELLHIDTLRRMGRTEPARELFWATADAWLAGERRQVWNTQWRRLAKLGTKLRVDSRDPRLTRIRDLGR